VRAQTAPPPAALTPPPGALPQTFEQLRVNTVADQLIRYLGQVVRWVDAPDTRAPTSALSASVLAAVERHPEARIATEQRTGAAYGTREAQAGWLPQVSAGVEGGRRSNDAVFRPGISSVPAYDDNSKAVTLSARQLVWDFGAVNHQIDSRLAVEMSVQARAQAKRSELTLRALSAWLELFRTREALAASQMNVLSRQQILRFIEERTELGASSASDVLRARARLADAQAAEVATRNQLSAAEAVYLEFFDQAAPGQLVLPEVPVLDAARLADLASLVSAAGGGGAAPGRCGRGRGARRRCRAAAQHLLRREPAPTRSGRRRYPRHGLERGPGGASKRVQRRRRPGACAAGGATRP
jgi:outer membrane protein TolC